MAVNGKKLTHEFANKVYDILVKYGGAYEPNRDHFVYVHCDDEYICFEFRFSGLFGFGGKYRSERNTIDYYQENHTKKLDKLQEKINKLLGEIK